MLIKTQQDVTPKVRSAMENTDDARLKEIMLSLVTHLHSFVRDVHLSEDEFRTATALIAEMGQLSNDKHNEVVLMAGSLGVSSLVCLLNNGNHGTTETSQNLLGPFWRLNSPKTANGGSILRSPLGGTAMSVTFTVLDPHNQPIEGALVDIWHCSPEGLYDNQDEAQVDMNLRGQFTTNKEGRIWFHSIKPIGYPIPTSGVVGRLLSAQNRHPFRPAHIHALVFKEGYKTLISQVYADDDKNLLTDAQFGVTQHLIGQFTPTPEGVHLDYTFKMERGEARLPKPPIK
jgi:catechol 1,2-dioxygenase